MFEERLTTPTIQAQSAPLPPSRFALRKSPARNPDSSSIMKNCSTLLPTIRFANIPSARKAIKAAPKKCATEPPNSLNAGRTRSNASTRYIAAPNVFLLQYQIYSTSPQVLVCSDNRTSPFSPCGTTKTKALEVESPLAFPNGFATSRNHDEPAKTCNGRIHFAATVPRARGTTRPETVLCRLSSLVG